MPGWVCVGVGCAPACPTHGAPAFPACSRACRCCLQEEPLSCCPMAPPSPTVPAGWQALPHSVVLWVGGGVSKPRGVVLCPIALAALPYSAVPGVLPVPWSHPMARCSAGRASCPTAQHPTGHRSAAWHPTGCHPAPQHPAGCHLATQRSTPQDVIPPRGTTPCRVPSCPTAPHPTGCHPTAQHPAGCASCPMAQRTTGCHPTP